MAITSLLSVLNGSTTQEDIFQTVMRGRNSAAGAAAQVSLNRQTRTGAATEAEQAVDRFGNASSVSLSAAARNRMTQAEMDTLKEEAIKRANAALGRAGLKVPVRQTRTAQTAAETPKPKDDAPVADKVKYNTKMLEATGADGKALNDFLGKFFEGTTSKEAAYIEDRLQGLLLRMKSPSRDLRIDLMAARSPANEKKNVFTLVDANNNRLRIEYSKGTDGSKEGDLRVTYTGRDIGGVDMQLSKTAPVDEKSKPTLDAQVTQKRISGSGRLDSTPIYDSKYNGPL